MPICSFAVSALFSALAFVPSTSRLGTGDARDLSLHGLLPSMKSRKGSKKRKFLFFRFASIKKESLFFLAPLFFLFRFFFFKFRTVKTRSIVSHFVCPLSKRPVVPLFPDSPLS